MKLTLRPVGRGNWRPLVLTIDRFPRKQGFLFRKDDGDRDLVKTGDVWVIDGRDWKISKVAA